MVAADLHRHARHRDRSLPARHAGRHRGRHARAHRPGRHGPLRGRMARHLPGALRAPWCGPPRPARCPAWSPRAPPPARASCRRGQHRPGGRLHPGRLQDRGGAEPGAHAHGAPQRPAGQHADGGGRLHGAGRAGGGGVRGPAVPAVAGLGRQRHRGRRGVHQRGGRAGAALRQYPRPGAGTGGGAGRRARAEPAGRAAQGQHGLRPQAALHRWRGHAGHRHRRHVQAVRASAQRGDGMGGRARPAGGRGAAVAPDRCGGRARHRLRADRRRPAGPGAAARHGRHALPARRGAGMVGAVRRVRGVGPDGSRPAVEDVLGAAMEDGLVQDAALAASDSQAHAF